MSFFFFFFVTKAHFVVIHGIAHCVNSSGYPLDSFWCKTKTKLFSDSFIIRTYLF